MASKPAASAPILPDAHSASRSSSSVVVVHSSTGNAAASTSIRTNALKAELCRFTDQMVKLLEKPKIQQALQAVSSTFVPLPGLRPEQRFAYSLYQRALPVNRERLASLVQSLTRGLKTMNQNMARPGFADNLADNLQTQVRRVKAAQAMEARAHLDAKA